MKWSQKTFSEDQRFTSKWKDWRWRENGIFLNDIWLVVALKPWFYIRSSFEMSWGVSAVIPWKSRPTVAVKNHEVSPSNLNISPQKKEMNCTWKPSCSFPRCSMYGLFTYIWVVLGVNVGKHATLSIWFYFQIYHVYHVKLLGVKNRLSRYVYITIYSDFWGCHWPIQDYILGTKHMFRTEELRKRSEEKTLPETNSLQMNDGWKTIRLPIGSFRP